MLSPGENAFTESHGTPKGTAYDGAFRG
jgi:hypothetical protein